MDWTLLRNAMPYPPYTSHIFYSYSVHGLSPTYKSIITTVVRLMNVLSEAVTLTCYRYPKSNSILVLELMDYPDSDEDAGGQAIGVNPNILDAEDMDVAQEPTDKTDPEGGEMNTSKQQGGSEWKTPSMESRSSYYTDGVTSSEGPDLPPIYLTVRKEREKKLVTRHLHGSAATGAESTAYGASVSQIETIGSFASAGDKRHNHTQLKHDYKHLRNMSTSFDTSNLTCITCNGGHKVLRREIEGEDVGLDYPPVFILTDQNFPAMIPAGGEGECLKIGALTKRPRSKRPQ